MAWRRRGACGAASAHSSTATPRRGNGRKIPISARPERSLRALFAIWNFRSPDGFDRLRTEEGDAFRCHLKRRMYGQTSKETHNQEDRGAAPASGTEDVERPVPGDAQGHL